MFRILPLVLLLCPVVRAEPVLEVYDIAPRTAHEELRLVLKLTNEGDKDLFVWSEGLTDIPFFARFRKEGEDFDLPSHECGTGARMHRLRPGTYVLIDVRIMQDILVSTPVAIRSRLFSDPDCQVQVWTNELKFTPREFKEEQKPNQPPQRNAGSRPSSGDSAASGTPSSLGPRG